VTFYDMQGDAGDLSFHGSSWVPIQLPPTGPTEKEKFSYM
jgi:hypothetical protein